MSTLLCVCCSLDGIFIIDVYTSAVGALLEGLMLAAVYEGAVRCPAGSSRRVTIGEYTSLCVSTG